MRKIALCFLLLLVGCDPPTDDPPVPNPQAETNPFGAFIGSVEATWLDGEDRKMKLLKEFVYVDPRGKQWVAPAESIVDGASIPSPFWSIIGGPFSGKYRNASVIHDVACVEKSEAWQDVHLAFYEACRCGGVGETKAKMMYWAVYNYGPRWISARESSPRVHGFAASAPCMAMAPPPPLNDETLKRVQEFFEANNPTLDEIESLQFDVPD